MKSRSLFTTVCAALLFAACSVAPQRPESVARNDYDGIKTYVTQLIRHEMDKSDITGMSVALVDDQRVVWAEGFGYADKENNKPASAQTLYRVGSISKLFTATAAMQLAEQGKLDIDRPLEDALPGFSIRSRFADSAPITPRNLMTHHSGLPRDFSQGMFMKNPESFTKLVDHVRANDAAYPPNHIFSYSNVGITLLGHAIQNTSGMPFAEYMRQYVLSPLAMDTATFEPGVAKSDLMAKAYRKGALVVEPHLRDVPAGGLNASVVDLSHFLSMVFADGRAGTLQVLKPESVHEMLRPQNTDVPLDLNFHNGLGWMLSTLGASTIENAGPVAHHSGATINFRAQMYVLPDHKLGVIVLANSSSAGRSIDRIATETLTLALEAKTGIKQPKREKVPAADPTWPVDKLQPYVGDYTSQIGHIRIRLDGASLRADAFGRTFNLVPRSDGLLGVQYKLLGLLPIDLGALDAIGITRRNVAGHDVLVASVGAQEMLVGERIEPPKDVTPWLKRVGAYAIANAGDDHDFIDRIMLTEERGFLIAELTMTDHAGPPQRLVLQPLSEHAAVLLGPLADGGGVLRCATDHDVEQCSFSGYALKRIAD
ncbi:MAG: beta-lactamase family protein [Gammaproteobacteria bacterium]|nr:beta-lactamase family protein [Gammaproteobacteria bacterium]MBU1416756.1 beta-lactamase family protein [Gammaproteobacteria bacterium]